MNDRSALSLSVGFALGLLLASLYTHSVYAALALFFLSGMVFALFTFVRANVYLLVSLALLAGSCGVLRVSFVPFALPASFQSDLGSEVIYEGIVVAPPDTRETHVRLAVEVEKEGEKTRVLALVPVIPHVRLGDRVLVTGILEEPESFETSGARVFAYDRYLAKDGVFAVVPFAHLEFVSGRQGFFETVYGALSDVKPLFLEGLSHALPEPHASLSGGLILGGKQGLGEKLQDAFMATGLIHVVVLSGYNVMIVADYVMRIARSIIPRAATSLGVGAIFLFVVISGAGAASIRAGLMAAIALYARSGGKTYNALRALFFVGFLMLMHNPLLLAYDPGFQLSFIATLGIILGAPPLEKALVFVRHTMFRSLIASTLAAQIAVLPLLLYQTGLFSLYALPANLIVLPLIPLAMFMSFMSGVAGLFFPQVVSMALSLPTFSLLTFIIGVVETLAAAPFAAVTLPPFPFVFVVLSYALLAYILLRFSSTPSSPKHIASQ